VAAVNRHSLPIEDKPEGAVRKHIGYGYIDAKYAEAIDDCYREHLNPPRNQLLS
jgi:hypothetical protein